MAIDDEEVERMYQAKLDYVREHGDSLDVFGTFVYTRG